MNLDPDTSSDMTESQVDTTSNAGARATLSSPISTLGERLAREARRIASRRIPNFPWLRSLDVVMGRVTSLPVPSEARFQRTEAPGFVPLSRPVSSEPLVGGDTEFWGQPLSPHVQKGLQDFVGPGTQSMRVHDDVPLSHPMSNEPVIGGDLQSWGQPLSPHVQKGLQDFVGPGTQSMRVHDDEVADVITRTHRADAITVGQHVFFRQGRFRPHEDEGFALLAHEATHVLQAMRPSTAWRRATAVGIQEEEQEASAQERAVLGARRTADPSIIRQLAPPERRIAAPSRYPAVPERQTAEPSRYPASPERLPGVSEPVGTPSPALRPMAAPTDRNLESGSTSAPSMPNFEDMRRALYRDLMSQIRADLERGG